MPEHCATLARLLRVRLSFTQPAGPNGLILTPIPMPCRNVIGSAVNCADDHPIIDIEGCASRLSLQTRLSGADADVMLASGLLFGSVHARALPA
jgi:hypothetical protein